MLLFFPHQSEATSCVSFCPSFSGYHLHSAAAEPRLHHRVECQVQEECSDKRGYSESDAFLSSFPACFSLPVTQEGFLDVR